MAEATPAPARVLLEHPQWSRGPDLDRDLRLPARLDHPTRERAAPQPSRDPASCLDLRARESASGGAVCEY